MPLCSATSVVRTLTGEALTPVKCTQSNMDRYLREARRVTGIVGIGLAAVDSAAQCASLRIKSTIDGNTLNNFITELSRALDPLGQHSGLYLR